ncbi:MAG: glycoside hydrolase family 15 protein [Acetobacteraceae bacterium]|nr:glycoside hydrolase family 15 protein [Acetobacteraceae bacterium]
MPGLIEDYAIIGNCEATALVNRNGSIDWLGLPRFDSAACFAALLGTPENGRWQIAPVGAEPRITRKYRDGSLVLETRFETDDGAVVLIDCMGRRDAGSDVVRLVRGERGRVKMRSELVIRFEYGAIIPWVRSHEDGALTAIAGPDQLTLRTSAAMHGENMRSVSEFIVSEGQEIPFVLTWSLSYHPTPEAADARTTIEEAGNGWTEWAKSLKPEGSGEWVDAVLRSVITLKALSHRETGGIVAAATTSLPEQLGGPRNWDYRFCWLRDATITLYALMHAGFTEEARLWRRWLLRAIAGAPEQMQIMYGVAGERRLTEYAIPWLKGYEGAGPVRIGNAASDQVQLDVYGEVLDALYQARRMGLAESGAGWSLEKNLIEHLETIWHEPDDGIWEVRGGRKHFVHSKVMAWVAFDRAVRSVEEFGLEGPLDRWKEIRERIHDQVCEQGFSRERNSFVQHYGSTDVDASLLLLSQVGFMAADDPRIVGTVAAIETDLLKDGFVARYNTSSGTDGLPGDEGVFLACSFWLADNYVLQNRYEEARALFERLLALRNDVGLLAEEYDPEARRQVGNFPQAFSHVALINTAHNLSRAGGPVQHRAESKETGAASP